MPQTGCPRCEALLEIPEPDVFFGKRILCPTCQAQLEVINESPVRIEEVHRGCDGWITDWLGQHPIEKEKKTQ